MKKVFIFVSDHGFGHAARTVALVRRLYQKSNCDVILKNLNSYKFLKQSLPKSKIIKNITDIGPIFNYSTNSVDVKATFDSIAGMINNEKKWLEKETEFLKRNSPDLIVADISPMALRLADKIKCPALCIGNFSWIDILKRMPYHDKKEYVLEWLKESFSYSEFAIKLPLSMRIEGFSKVKKSSLLCREVTQDKNLVMKRLGFHHPFVLTYLGNKKLNAIKTKSIHQKIVRMASGKITVNKKILLPSYFEGQNLVACSKLVIAKPGYSILAECVKFKTPVYILPKRNYPEDVALCRHMKKLKIAKIIDHKSGMIDMPNETQINEMGDSIDEKAIRSLERLPHPTEFILEFIKK